MSWQFIEEHWVSWAPLRWVDLGGQYFRELVKALGWDRGYDAKWELSGAGW